MSYLKTIEFLVKEVAKANEQIESLTRKAEDDKSVMDRLGDFHDKHFEDAMSAKEELKQMTIEKDHWKEEALEYRDKESDWWAKEKDYKAKIKGLSDAVDRFKSDYLSEADLVSELEDKLSLTEKRYKSLIEQFKLSDNRYQDKIAELQLEINHLKNNK